jgi:site-specific DNA-methyltransferase (adenine-specific)
MTTILLGNCLEKMKSFPDKSIDLIICDLPYGCLLGSGGKEKMKRTEDNIKNFKMGGCMLNCSWDIKIDLETFWKEVKRIRKNEHTPTIHFCTTKYGYELIKSNEKEFRYELIYSKTNAIGFLTANKMPMRSHEMIYVFSKAGAYYNRIDISGNYARGGGGRSTANFLPIADMPNFNNDNTGKRCIKSVIEMQNKKMKGQHPTAKPLDLYKFLIERYSKPGDTVLDPTFGSMNSGLACIELGRKYIGIEMDKGFFDKGMSKIVANK